MTASTTPSVSSLRGIYPAALTMFDNEGELDIESSVAHLDALISEGAEGLVVGGTSGEFIGLTAAERTVLTREALGAVAGRVPVIVGTGSYSTRETIALTEVAVDAGAHGALVILPFYQRPHRAEVLEHFRAVYRSTGAPLFVYNNPTNSGTEEMSALDLAELEREGAAVGVKSTFPTVHQTYEAIHATTPSFRAFHGGLNAPLEGLAAGACGWISGILNVALPAALRMRDAIEAANLPAARDIWARELAPVRFIYTRQQLGPINDLELYRSILRLQGKPAGHSRHPLLPLTDDQNARLGALLVDTGLLA